MIIKKYNYKKYTTIRLERETVNLLREVGKKMETYDEIIKRLIKNTNGENHNM